MASFLFKRHCLTVYVFAYTYWKTKRKHGRGEFLTYRHFCPFLLTYRYFCPFLLTYRYFCSFLLTYRYFCPFLLTYCYFCLFLLTYRYFCPFLLIFSCILWKYFSLSLIISPWTKFYVFCPQCYLWPFSPAIFFCVCFFFKVLHLLYLPGFFLSVFNTVPTVRMSPDTFDSYIPHYAYFLNHLLPELIRKIQLFKLFFRIS